MTQCVVVVVVVVRRYRTQCVVVVVVVEGSIGNGPNDTENQMPKGGRAGAYRPFNAARLARF